MRVLFLWQFLTFRKSRDRVKDLCYCCSCKNLLFDWLRSVNSSAAMMTVIFIIRYINFCHYSLHISFHFTKCFHLSEWIPCRWKWSWRWWLLKCERQIIHKCDNERICEVWNNLRTCLIRILLIVFKIFLTIYKKNKMKLKVVVKIFAAINGNFLAASNSCLNFSKQFFRLGWFYKFWVFMSAVAQ